MRTFVIVGLLLSFWAVAGEPSAGFGVKTDSGGKYWFVDPDGNEFLSLGINNIVPEPWRPRPQTQYYNPVPTVFKGDFEAWEKDVFSLLSQNGFNTVGCWSDGRLNDGPLYGVICLYVAGYAQDRCLEGLRPGFEDRIRNNMDTIFETKPMTDKVFGVFLDNEMSWYGHAPWGEIPNATLLEAALGLPADDGARQAAIDFLKKRYSTAQALSAAWGKPLDKWENLSADYARSCINEKIQKDRNDFIGLAADAFYGIACRVVRQVLPGKLILGSRIAEYAPEPVIRVCGKYCDVISINHYTRRPAADPDLLARYWIWGGGKPLIITEYSWRGQENTSGNPNSGGAGAIVKTQAQRGENYSRYVEDLLSYPMVVGAHWFEFSDQSPQGRFDGENSNYGVVDIYHRPYKELLAAMKLTNDRVAKLHAKSEKTVPTSLPEPKKVVFEPGQYPQRPEFVDMLNSEMVKGPEVFTAPDAKIGLQKMNDFLAADLDTGKEWGCGILFFGPKTFRQDKGPEYSTDLGGYSIIEIDAQIDKGLVFDVFFDEAGVAEPGSDAYDTSGGDDGEAFILPTIQGKGDRHVYRLELKDLQPRTNWGNQRGLRKVDAHSMKGLAIFFAGSQGQKQVNLYSIKLVR